MKDENLDVEYVFFKGYEKYILFTTKHITVRKRKLVCLTVQN